MWLHLWCKLPAAVCAALVMLLWSYWGMTCTKHRYGHINVAYHGPRLWLRYPVNLLYLLNGDSLYSFTQVDTVPWGLNDMFVTCFVQNTARTKHQSTIPTLSKQPYSERLVWVLSVKDNQALLTLSFPYKYSWAF